MATNVNPVYLRHQENEYLRELTDHMALAPWKTESGWKFGPQKPQVWRYNYSSTLAIRPFPLGEGQSISEAISDFVKKLSSLGRVNFIRLADQPSGIVATSDGDCNEFYIINGLCFRQATFQGGYFGFTTLTPASEKFWSSTQRVREPAAIYDSTFRN